jgi:phosphonate transport system ATP-binding protein
MHEPPRLSPVPIEEPVLAIRGLSKNFGARQVLSDVSFDIAPGEFVVVLGPSGAGKSTLFRCITRLTEPNRGEIQCDGVTVTDLKGRGLLQFRRHVGFVFQQFNLVKRLNAIDNVLAGRLADAPLWRVLCRRFDKADRQHALNCLDAVGLLDYAYCRADCLSGGQQQRVAIARALAQGGKIIIADEPIASLDPETGLGVLRVLRNIAHQHRIAILCSLHQADLATQMADRILGFRDGRLVLDKSTSSLSVDETRCIYVRAA